MNVVAIPEVRAYFNVLAKILYENEYFGFEESARRYVVELFNDIKKNLPTKLHKPAPEYFEKYGKKMHYAVFKKSKNTHWYVFFNKYDDRGEIIYLIRYIANNHTVAKYL